MIGSTLNDRFKLEKKLGQGGMGTVYLARDVELDRAVAVKLLHQLKGEEVERQIKIEAQITARLQHDHIVRLYDIGRSEGMLFLVMEVVDGVSFHYRWQKFPLEERLRILKEVAEALDYAHHQGVIHRDIKPGNILLSSTDRAKLSDFGLSVKVEDAHATRSVKGTPLYMSPEQASGKKLDHRTDLYALGVILYECVTGTPPFQGPLVAVMTQHVTSAPDPPRQRNPEISEALEDLILSLLAKKPDERPATGRAIAEALTPLIAQVSVASEVLNLQRTQSLTPTSDPTASETGAASGQATSGQPPLVSSVQPKSEDAFASAVALHAKVAEKPDGLATTQDPKRAFATRMLEEIAAEPIQLSPEQRFLAGHYLAYLLGGSRKKGLFGKRPLDALNADRARLLVAMTSIMQSGADDQAIERGARLLDEQFDLRPTLNPIVVAKYLAARESAAKRKKFRQAREKLREASSRAQDRLLDDQGVLNPGLMPQTFDDLWKVTPSDTEVDDELIERWNRLAEIWHGDESFRQAVLRYATTSAHRDPASIQLWPEVVYPLIERARWQRRFRSKAEAFWDLIGGRVLRLPDRGVRLDEVLESRVPSQVIEQLDASLDAFDDDPEAVFDEAAEVDASTQSRLSGSFHGASQSLHELAADTAVKSSTRLIQADPTRFTMGELRELWTEALQAMRAGGATSSAKHRNVPVGPYRLAVIPSIRGRAAGQVAIVGMLNKQLDMLVPSIRLSTSGSSRPIIAVWIYTDGSVAATHVDFRNTQVYVCWHAPTGAHHVFEDAGDFNHMLYQLGLEVPEQLGRVLSKGFRPTKPEAG